MIACRIRAPAELCQILLKRGADINFFFEKETPLIAAIESENEELVNCLLTQNVDVNLVDQETGETPLFVAVRKGNANIVKILLQRGAKIDEINPNTKTTALWLACQQGLLQVVKELVKFGADVQKERQPKGISPLHIATYEKHSEVVKVLLIAGADVNKPRPDTQLAPLLIAAYNGDINTIKVLLEFGADMKYVSGDGSSPLHFACLGHHPAAVKFLAENGADINYQRRIDGASPLLVCLMERDLTSFFVLLGQKEINMNAADKKGRTPLFVACSIPLVPAIRALMDFGVDINQSFEKTSPFYAALLTNNKDAIEAFYPRLSQLDVNYLNTKNKITFLYFAAQADIPDLTEKLLELGADPNLPSYLDSPVTPLFVACQLGHKQIVELLLKHPKIDVNAGRLSVNKSNPISPLFVATFEKHLEIVKMLLERGADPNIASEDGATSLDIAIGNSDSELITLLSQHGAK